MVQGYINPNIIFIGEKLWLVAWNKKILVLYKEKNWKMPIKNEKNWKNKNIFFLILTSQGLLKQKLGS